MIHSKLKSKTTTALLLVLFLTLLPAAVQAQRQFMKPLPVTSAKLVADYQSNFHQADAMYTGKLLLVTGVIKTIQPAQRTYNYFPNKAYPYLTMDGGQGRRPLIIYLLKWESQKYGGNNQMQPGYPITIMGFCQGVPSQLSLVDACIYPAGCGGPIPEFRGPVFKIPPTR